MINPGNSSLVGIGVDVVDIERIAASLEREGFAERVFSATERERCEVASAETRLARYAVRFAAKEAFYKALGTHQEGLGWQDVEVAGESGEPPGLIPSEKARRAMEAAGVGRVHLSLTHDGGVAIAFVVLERAGGANSVL